MVGNISFLGAGDLKKYAKPSWENSSHARTARLREALAEILDCHAEGGFVEPNRDVLDKARAALLRVHLSWVYRNKRALGGFQVRIS